MRRESSPTAAQCCSSLLHGSAVLAFVVFAGCGGGAATTVVQPAPFVRDFSLSITPASVTVSQGTTSSGIQLSVQPVNGFSGSVQVTLSGLPNGVSAYPPSPFALQSGGSTTLLLGATPFAPAGSASITAQGTSGSLSHTASLSLSVQIGSPANVSRTTFVRTDSMAMADDPPGEPHHRHMVYDAANRRLFVANRAANRVEVRSTLDGSSVATVDVAGASGADLSPDGKTVWIGTVTEQIVAIDTTSLQRTQTSQLSGIAPVPNTLFDRPEEVIALASGKLLVRLRQADAAESLLALFDPASNALSNLTSSAPLVFQQGLGVMARSSDHTRVFVGANDTTGEAVVFDDNGNLAVSAKTIAPGSILYAAANADGSRFAALINAGGTEQLLLLDSALNVIGSRATVGARGVVFSRDGTALYLAETQTGNAVLTALSVSDLHSLGQAQDLSLQGVATEPEETDETAFVFGLSNRGVSFIDLSALAATISDVPSLGAPPAVTPASGPNTGGTSVALSGTNFGANPMVRFGVQSAASVNASGSTQIQATAPPSANSGAVNLTAYFSGNTLALAPDAFSYGPQILEVLPNAGNPSGNDSIAIYGYGFGEDASKVSVTFGSATATVQNVEDVPSLSASLGLDATYPFPVQRVTLTLPAGMAGKVDVAVNAPSGSATAVKAFQYLRSSQIFAKPSFYKFISYDEKRQWIYLSNYDAVDVFDLAAGNYRAGILPPGGPPPDALVREAALTPDASQLVIADYGAQSVYLMNPDTAAGSTIHLSELAGTTVGPVRVAATSANTVFVGLADYVNSSSGCSTCLQQMTLTSSPITVGPAPQPQVSALISAPLLSASSAGDAAFFAFASAPGQPVASWTAATPGQFLTIDSSIAATDLATAADGTSFAMLAGGAIEIRDQSLALRSVTTNAELEGISQRTGVPGVALHPSGALVYVPFLTGAAPIAAPFTGLQGGVDIRDAHTGRLRLRVMLPEPLAMLAADTDGLHGKFLALDENGQRLFALTASGLSVVQLDSVPLGFGTISPASASATGGSTATIRGSGFQSGTTVTLGGKSASAIFVDMNTLQVTIPALPSGPQRITLTNPDGETVSYDAAFNAN